MKNKLLKLIVLCIFVIVVIMFVNFANKKDENIDNKYQVVSDIDEYYEVTSGVSKFYQFYNDLFLTEENVDYGSLGEETEEDSKIDYIGISDSVYSLLDEEYTSFSGITRENLIEKIEKHKRTSYVQIDSVYRICKQENLSLYYVKVTLVDQIELKTEKMELLLKKYDFNNTFSIYLSDYIQNKGYNNLQEGQKVDIRLEPMQTNILNLYDEVVITDTDYAENLFNDYKKSCLYNRQRAYDMLDEDLKSEKFDTFEKFDNYIKKNIVSLVTMKFNGYNFKTADGVTEYTCYDNKNNKYIFKISAPMQYKIVIEAN